MKDNRGQHTQPQRSNNLIQRPSNLLNNQRQLSRQAARSSLARLNHRDVVFVALGFRGGAHGFDVAGGADDEAVDGGDLRGEGRCSGGFVGFGGGGGEGCGCGVCGGGVISYVFHVICGKVGWMG